MPVITTLYIPIHLPSTPLKKFRNGIFLNPPTLSEGRKMTTGLQNYKSKVIGRTRSEPFYSIPKPQQKIFFGIFPHFFLWEFFSPPIPPYLNFPDTSTHKIFSRYIRALCLPEPPRPSIIRTRVLRCHSYGTFRPSFGRKHTNHHAKSAIRTWGRSWHTVLWYMKSMCWHRFCGKKR